ncbi:MAG: hypothetical protein AAF371_01625 [Pseudomonadota bacterium]
MLAVALGSLAALFTAGGTNASDFEKLSPHADIFERTCLAEPFGIEAVVEGAVQSGLSVEPRDERSAGSLQVIVGRFDDWRKAEAHDFTTLRERGRAVPVSAGVFEGRVAAWQGEAAAPAVACVTYASSKYAPPHTVDIMKARFAQRFTPTRRSPSFHKKLPNGRGEIGFGWEDKTDRLFFEYTIDEDRVFWELFRLSIRAEEGQ